MPRLLAVALLACLSLSACGGVPATIHVQATASADLNPGSGGSAFPAQVRLYQLRTPEKFNNADFFQLADHEATVLGSDLVSRDEVILHPRETRVVDLATKKETRFVGVVVAYRNIDQATWRAVTPARGNLQLSLAADRVTLTSR